MIHCFKCGADLPENLAYCLHCGAKLDDEQETVVRPGPDPGPPVEPHPARDSGAGKFILGSLLGAVAVIVLLVIGAFVLFSMRSRETPVDVPVNNVNVNNATPAPTRSPTPTPRKPTPSPTASAVNANTEPVSEPKTCTIVNPAGGSVNLRRYCDTRDCSADPTTLYNQADPGETVERTGRKPVTTGNFTWVQIEYGGDVLWISAARIDCE